MRHLIDGAFGLLMQSVHKQVVQFLFGFLLLGVYTTDVSAQSQIKNRIEFSALISDTTIYLGDWVIESSIMVSSISLETDSITWNFDFSSGMIRINTFPLKKVTIDYKSLPITLPKNISLNSRSETTESDINEVFGIEIEPENSNSMFDSDLKQSGSLSRGIIIGSNQDFALESGLNFELSGQLTDDIKLDAVLTDQSIPIQPDGTTQSIREFDKVLIRLRSEKTQLEMGDVDVSLQQSTFAKLNRRLQGAAGNYQYGNSSVRAAISSVRGTFLTQQFTGEEGVQGPYRLRGKNGEEFIIVLAGTERVYVNGILVQRGEENEYIIDYGLGEITFTDNIFIKDETRIFVEYEYIDQDFNRTLLAAEASDNFLDNKLKIGVSVIRQADGDDLLSQQTLTEQDIQILEQAGDNQDLAIISGVITNPDNDEINVRYTRIDTTFNGQLFSIFKNIPNSSASNLVVRFSNVGQGNGSYERVGDSINGLLYKWIGPGNGSYEPFRQLPAPQKHQMVAMNTELQLSDKVTFSGEISLSEFDQNRFSTIDNEDNTDIALQSSIEARKLNIGIADLDMVYTRRQSGKNFEFFERTREVEFDRKWNISAFDINGEVLDELQTSLHFTDQSILSAGVGHLSFSGFESTRQNAQLSLMESENFGINYSQEYISSENRLINSSAKWLRQIGRINTQFGSSFQPFVHFEHEDQRDQDNSIGLTQNSQKFYEVGPGIEYSDDHITFSMAYILRKEEGVEGGKFRDQAMAREQRYQLGYNSKTGFITENKVHFRNKKYTEAFLANGEADQNGFQINSTTSINRENFSSRFIYKANTQRQAIRQEAYIEVGPELGQFVWIDENDNGIEEIDEFFPELSPNEGTYVLQFLPSDELLPVINFNSRMTLDWQPFQKISNGTNSESWFQTIRLNSLIDIRENSTSQKESDIYLLRLDQFRNDSTTLNGSFRFEQGIELEPTKDLEVSLNYNFSDNLNKRTTEVQLKKSNQLFFGSNYRLNQDVQLRLDASIGNSSLKSDELSNRTYDFKFISINPGFTTRVSRSFQYGLNLGYSLKEDQQFELIEAQIIKLKTFTRAFLWQKIQASTNLELRETKIEGQANSFTRFELTEGTGTGTNLVWSLNANYRINNRVRLNLNYDGRTVQDRPDIHTIKVVVSAVF